MKGVANLQDYRMRMYDPRLGRFLSVDPLSKNFHWYTPYQFAGNKPIEYIDLDGGQPKSAKKDQERKDLGVTSFNQSVELARDKGTEQWFSVMSYASTPGKEFYWKNNDGTPGIYSISTARMDGEWTGYWQLHETYEQKQFKVATDR